ncbi:MAG: UDP-N-acetylmuramate--L-alanine ligase [Candidatus Coproplasma sp.]
MLNSFVNADCGYYFIGIGGVSMSALAKMLVLSGARVAGSDIMPNEYTAELEKMGAVVEYGEETEKIARYGTVVYSDAIRENDARLKEAIRLRKTIIPRGEFLRQISVNYGKVIAVAGCHGKTTCTSMLAHIFACAEKKFTCHIGGSDLRFSNCYCGGEDFFITEACEYNKNFLRLKPDVAVVLNSDADHLECYGTVKNLKEAYVDFAESAKISVCLYGDVEIKDAVTFGFDGRARYYARNIIGNGGKYTFTLYEGCDRLGKIPLNVYGKHNVLNALAAAAAARSLGIDFDKISDGLRDFSGVKRRFERMGTFNGADIIADYAHHPNEIKATLRTASQITKGNLYVVFQPHTYSRTKNMFADFVKTLSPIKNLLIYKTFAAREYYDDGGSALKLSQAIKKSRYADGARDVVNFLRGATSGDLILFLGAGDIYYIARNIAD